MHYLEKELLDIMKKDSLIFKFLEEGSLDGVWYWDMENPEQEWYSPGFRKLFGYEEGEIPNLSSWWQNNIFPEDMDVAVANARAHLEDPNHLYDQVVRYRHKDGSAVWVRCRGLAIKDKEGKAIRFLGAHNDMTEVMRNKNALQQNINSLEQFTRIISHDLAEPLRTISCYTQLLSKKLGNDLEDQTKRYIEHILKASVKMNKMIKGLLEICMTGSAEILKDTVDCSSLVMSTVEDLEFLLKECEATINTSITHSVEGNELLLQQVFLNLITNAIRFRNPSKKPVVTISSKEYEEGMILFEIADNGVGIEKGYLERIFNPFKKVNKESEGSGIGLSLVKNVVDRHGGKVWVESTLGEGSSFYFILREKNNTKRADT